MMAQSFTSNQRIAVAAHPKLPAAVSEASLVAELLNSLGLAADYGLLYDEELTRKLNAGVYSLLVALGGDGTMLRSGHLCGPLGIPILGINMGRFGFLMDTRQTQWREFLPRLLSGDYWLEQRMMLVAEHWHGTSLIGKWDVLNEVVVGRGHIVRPVHLVAEVDGRFLATYVADSLIAATATGSTAYALAAGGPILPPELRNILLVPVAPHLSIDRAIVMAAGSSVCITVHSDHQAELCVDGQLPLEMMDGDCVKVYASEHSVHFVRFQDPGYFYRNLTPHMNQNPSTGNSR
jgi:NAD+ kinase